MTSMVGVFFTGQRTNDSDVWKNVGSTSEIITNRQWRDKIAMKAGLSSFEKLRLDT